MSVRSKTVVPFAGKLAAMKRLQDETGFELQICDLVRTCDLAEFVYYGEMENKLNEGTLQLVLEGLTQRAKDLKALYFKLHDIVA